MNHSVNWTAVPGVLDIKDGHEDIINGLDNPSFHKCIAFMKMDESGFHILAHFGNEAKPVVKKT